jgi:hypothetical protein
METKGVKVRWLWVVCVFIIAAAIVILWIENSCQSQANKCVADYASQADSERVTSGLAVHQQAAEQQAIAAACEPNGYFCRLFGAANLPTLLLVFIGIAGIGAAIQTLRAIENQRDVMINSERSWVMVEVEPTPGAGSIWDGETMTREVMDLRAGHTTFTARITCKNDGKSPAWIIEKRACLDIIASLPETPDWGRTRPIQIEPEPLSVGQIGKPKDEALTCKRPRELGKMVIIYGIVKYRDTFGDGRSTTFGYKVRDDGVLERLPYSKYNENT